MEKTIDKLIALFDKRRGECDYILDRIDTLEVDIKGIENSIEDNKQAKDILVQIGLRTQNLFKAKIESLVTSCLRGIFERDYEFVMELSVRNNKTSCRPMVRKGDMLLDPRKETMGGGVIDVAALAVRVVLFTMERPRRLPVIVMDEPLAAVHGFEMEASNMIKRLSLSLGLQFIIISQIEELGMAADRLFHVTMKGGVSRVMEG